MMARAIALLFGFGFLLFGCSAPQTQVTLPGGFTAAGLAAVKRAIDQDIAEKRNPGAVMLVSHRGATVFSHVAGVLDPKTGAPMSEDAVFRIASMTKPIVSVGLMLLVIEGKVALAAPVSSYLPELKDLKVAAKPAAGSSAEFDLVRANRQPTVHDLLKHTAGFTYDGDQGQVPLMYRKAGVDLEKVSGPEDFIKILSALPLASQPGEAWEYGISTDILGILIERVSGKRLDVFLRERIFEPLKMVDTGFYVEEPRHGRLSEPFERFPNGEPIKVRQARSRPLFLSGGGGLVSTAGDYMRFCRMLLNGGELDGVRLLSRKTVEFMTSDHLSGVTGPNYFVGPGYGFGLGFGVRAASGISHVHGSAGDYFWIGAAGTMFWIDPKERLAVVFMTTQPGTQWRNIRVYRNLLYAAIE